VLRGEDGEVAAEQRAAQRAAAVDDEDAPLPRCSTASRTSALSSNT
jgi:hypothetical protein